ncbi:MAG: hypothetical protein ACXV1K_02300 [Kineosporiaceae bacterium]
MRVGGAGPGDEATLSSATTPLEPVLVADPVAARRWGRLSWAFAAVWLIYLVPTLQDAATRPNLAARIVGVGAVLGFAVEYALVFAALGRMRREGRRPDARWIARALGSSVALFIIAAVTVGQSSLAMFVFIAVQAVFVLPRSTGLAVAGGLIAAAEILSRTVPGWEPVDGLWISIALAAVAVWGVTGMIERNVELARAQATIADMAVQAERSRFAATCTTSSATPSPCSRSRPSSPAGWSASTPLAPGRRSPRSSNWPARR